MLTMGLGSVVIFPSMAVALTDVKLSRTALQIAVKVFLFNIANPFFSKKVKEFKFSLWANVENNKYL